MSCVTYCNHGPVWIGWDRSARCLCCGNRRGASEPSRSRDVVKSLAKLRKQHDGSLVWPSGYARGSACIFHSRFRWHVPMAVVVPGRAGTKNFAFWIARAGNVPTSRVRISPHLWSPWSPGYASMFRFLIGAIRQRVGTALQKWGSPRFAWLGRSSCAACRWLP